MNPAKPVLVIYYSLTGNTERVAKEQKIAAFVQQIRANVVQRDIVAGRGPAHPFVGGY